jgi:hypothetical protein
MCIKDKVFDEIFPPEARGDARSKGTALQGNTAGSGLGWRGMMIDEQL